MVTRFPIKPSWNGASRDFPDVPVTTCHLSPSGTPRLHSHRGRWVLHSVKASHLTEPAASWHHATEIAHFRKRKGHKPRWWRCGRGVSGAALGGEVAGRGADMGRIGAGYTRQVGSGVFPRPTLNLSGPGGKADHE
jgi:hypothetical protein